MTTATDLPRARFYDNVSPGAFSEYHLSQQEIAYRRTRAPGKALRNCS